MNIFSQKKTGKKTVNFW